MSVSEERITVIKGNDPAIVVLVKQRSASTGVVSAYDLTGCTMEMYLKTNQTDTDGSPTYTTAGGSPAITFLDTVNGKAQVQMAHASINAINPTWYRLDVIKNGFRSTIKMGEFDVVSA